MQVDPSEQKRARGKPILGQNHPGMIDTPTGWAIQQDGVGHTWHLKPQFHLAVSPRGPNARMAYADSFRWVYSRPPVDTTVQIPAGTYLSVALFPGGAFYNLQRGGYFCRKADVDTLRSEIHAHEMTHYRQAIAVRKSLKLHEVFEYTVALSASDTIVDSFERHFLRQSLVYLRTIHVNDSLIDIPRMSTSLTCQMRFR